MNLLRTALLAAALLVAPPVLSYEDMVSGFAITPSAPFIVDEASTTSTGLRLGILSTTGEPPVAGSGKFICELTYDLADANAALTQAEINEAMQSMWRREQMTSSVAGQFNVDNLSYFGVGEVRGVEFVLIPKSGPDAENVRLVLSLAETPKGRFVLSCATTAAAIESALPQFQAIRDTARLP